MLQEAMNAWLLEHPEEEQQWLQVKGLLHSLGFSVGALIQDRFSGQIFWLPVSGNRNDKCRIGYRAKNRTGRNVDIL